LLVHGNGAHANWWDFIAPALTEQHCVLALHLSGMGNSGQREEYSLDSYANDVISVARHAGYTRDISLVGHSLGGVIAIRTTQLYANCIKGLVVVDSPLVKLMENAEGLRQRHLPDDDKNLPRSYKPREYYADYAAVRQRFRLIPEQPCHNEFIVDYIAQFSIGKFAKGWGWKFDPKILSSFSAKNRLVNPTQFSANFAFIYGEQSDMVSAEDVEKLKKLFRQRGPILGIADAYHHILLDQPQELIVKIREVLSSWQQQDSLVRMHK
jgi:pimeloyl-ACP methyl ester carboxylesterase